MPRFVRTSSPAGSAIVVCDLKWFGMEHLRTQLDDGTSAWAGRVEFRAGRYGVLRLSGAEMPAWLEENFGL